MLKCLSMIVLGWLLFPMVAWSEPNAVVCNSEVQIDQPVVEGETVQGTFAICNQGDTALKIVQVSPSCGCTAPSFDPTIPPGGRGEIVLNLNTTGYRGHIRKSALVQTDDPNHRRFRIMMECTVQ